MSNIRIPPHADDAERSILGAILIDKNAIVDISVVLKPEMFYNDNNGKIYESMISLYENRDPIDVLTVSNWLKKQAPSRFTGYRVKVDGFGESAPSFMKRSTGSTVMFSA